MRISAGLRIFLLGLFILVVVLVVRYQTHHRTPHFSSQTDDSIDDSTVLIYNRIPKTGSTSFMHLPYELCKENDYHVILLNLTRNSHVLTLRDQIAFGRNITQWTDKLPAIHHGHFAYINFENLGIRRGNVLYINLVRRPLERLVSYYYFLRYGDDFRKDKIRSRMGDKQTFDECVEQHQYDCDPKKMWLQIPWFCGHFKKCWEPGNRWALDQAKHNLVNKYFLVGVTEELEAFIDLLEQTLPRFFRGAGAMYRSSGDLQHIRRTKHKDELSDETIEKMKQSKVWKMENDFYEFAAAHFQWLKAGIGETRTNFHYEKIRPLRPR